MVTTRAQIVTHGTKVLLFATVHNTLGGPPAQGYVKVIRKGKRNSDQPGRVKETRLVEDPTEAEDFLTYEKAEAFIISQGWV